MKNADVYLTEEYSEKLKEIMAEILAFVGRWLNRRSDFGVCHPSVY